jgi:PAS domain S-box-containing protein
MAQDSPLKRNDTWQGLALELLATGRDLSEVLTAVVHMVEDRCEKAVGSILLLDPDGRHLRLGASPRLPAEYNRAIDGVEIGPAVGSCGTAVYRREPVIVQDISTDPLWASFRELAGRFDLRACWSHPIFASDRRVLGSFAIYPQEARKPTESELKLIESAAHLAGVAIEWHRDEKALRDSEERNSSLLEAAPDALIIVDQQGQIVKVNQQAEKLFGYPREEMLGHPIELLLPSRFHSAHLQQREQYSAHPVARTMGERRDLTALRKDGTEFPAEISFSPLQTDSGALISSAVRDITQRKQVERALVESREKLTLAMEAATAANKAKDQFIAILSHELRTPLTPVLLTLQMMEADTTLSPEQRESLAMIRRNVDLESRLIDDLLDLTRIARGKLQLHMGVVDLHKKIASVIQICESDIQSRHQKLTLDLKADPRHIEADPARIQQVLWNILKNATKFTPVGGEIMISTHNPNEGRVAVEVRDNGIGIDAELLHKIFDAFEQGEKSRHRQFGGLGLGLAISQGLVQMQGGTMTAQSEGKGKGATFTLEFGATTGPPTSVEPTNTHTGLNRPRMDRRLLLVEAHADTAKATGRLLRMLGYDVIIAQTVAEALRAIEHQSFDALLSDIALPEGKRQELIRQLRARLPIKAIAISGFGMEDDIRKSKEAGFIAHLTKPVDIAQLEKLLAEICD